MIRAAMTVWRELSLELIALTEKNEEAIRDEVIEQIERILDKRDLLQKQISQPFSTAEKELGQELLLLEKEVQSNLNLFTKKIRTNISESQSKKNNITNYTNPYGGNILDGAYYDSKH